MDEHFVKNATIKLNMEEKKYKIKCRFFNPGKEYKQHRSKLLPKIDKVLKDGQLILRKDVEDFEKNLANFLGAKYAVGVNSATDALYLCLRYLKIGIGDQVLVPSRTFVATPQVVVQLGAEPVYYDLDSFSIEGLDVSKVKAIMPVHIEGMIDGCMEEILKTAKEHNWAVIEDSAQALGAKYKDKFAGTLGLAGCFSFYPAKILGAAGDAGAVVMNDKKMYEWLLEARNHFKTDAKDWGVNSRMDNLQAVILNFKIKTLKKNLAHRKKIAELYDKELSTITPFFVPRHILGRVWQDYIVRCTDKQERDNLFSYLKENGIETLKNNYPFPVPKLPLAQKYEDETLRLPCNQVLTSDEVKIIIKKIKQFYQGGK